MTYQWKEGDRARIVRVSTLLPDHHGQVGDEFVVTLVSQIGPHQLLTGLDGYKTVLGELCKPVVRVKAQSRPAQPTPAELTEGYWERRRAHGASRYQTGHDVFKPWDFGKGPVPKYEEQGN